MSHLFYFIFTYVYFSVEFQSRSFGVRNHKSWELGRAQTHFGKWVGSQGRKYIWVVLIFFGDLNNGVFLEVGSTPHLLAIVVGESIHHGLIIILTRYFWLASG
jgi:hypothetical protein